MMMLNYTKQDGEKWENKIEVNLNRIFLNMNRWIFMSWSFHIYAPDENEIKKQRKLSNNIQVVKEIKLLMCWKHKNRFSFYVFNGVHFKKRYSISSFSWILMVFLSYFFSWYFTLKSLETLNKYYFANGLCIIIIIIFMMFLLPHPLYAKMNIEYFT